MVSHWEVTQTQGSEILQGLPQSASGIGAPGISVVVPLWNEELNVAPLVERVFQALRNETLPVELILVDDASDDTTWDRILEAQQAESRLRPVRLLRHSGQSAALWAGFSASRGSIIATLDGDLQNDPADLPLLLKELSNHDLVCGMRTKRMDNIVRRVSSSIARWARKTVLGVNFRDTGCNLRVFKRSVLRKLFPFNGLHRFMPVLAQCTGHSVLEIPVSHHPRTAGKSKYGIWNRLGRGIWDLVAISWYTKRQLSDIPAVEHISGKSKNLREGN
jgi:glycosyltransferase involved in cell wall biosynthesis